MVSILENNTPSFGEFVDCWQALPREHHALVPSITACSPVSLGRLMPFIALGAYRGKYELRTTYVGSEIERLAGTVTDDMNYYDSMSDDLKAATHVFHQYLLDTPCGAYIADIITAKSGLKYRFETMQFPLCDDTGAVNYLMVFGQGRSSIKDRMSREELDHSVSNIQDMHYLDIGAGAPAGHIIDFKFFSGKDQEPRPSFLDKKQG